MVNLIRLIIWSDARSVKTPDAASRNIFLTIRVDAKESEKTGSCI